MTATLEQRTDQEYEQLLEITKRFRHQAEHDIESFVHTDLEFHLFIAKASHNPLFPILLESLSRFASYIQNLSCDEDYERRLRAVTAHEAVLEAIRVRDSKRASIEMEAHLRFNMARFIDNQPNLTRPKAVDRDLPL